MHHGLAVISHHNTNTDVKRTVCLSSHFELGTELKGYEVYLKNFNVLPVSVL